MSDSDFLPPQPANKSKMIRRSLVALTALALAGCGAGASPPLHPQESSEIGSGSAANGIVDNSNHSEAGDCWIHTGPNPTEEDYRAEIEAALSNELEIRSRYNLPPATRVDDRLFEEAHRDLFTIVAQIPPGGVERLTTRLCSDNFAYRDLHVKYWNMPSASETTFIDAGLPAAEAAELVEQLNTNTRNHPLQQFFLSALHPCVLALHGQPPNYPTAQYLDESELEIVEATRATQKMVVDELCPSP